MLHISPSERPKSAGRIHHVIWSFSAKFRQKNARSYFCTWRLGALKTSTFGRTWCDLQRIFHIRFAIPAAIYRSAFKARAWKCPPECFLGNFGHLPRSAPKSAFRVLLAFLGPKNAKKHSKSTLWGTPRQVPKIAQKALRGALSGPGLKSTPVNGGRDRNIRWRMLAAHQILKKFSFLGRVTRIVFLVPPRRARRFAPSSG